jgi:hypothetical protein
MWILATGVPECDKNLSVFFELKLAAFMQKIARIQETCLFSRFTKKCLTFFSKIGENCLVSSPNLEKISAPTFPNLEKASAKFYGARGLTHLSPPSLVLIKLSNFEDKSMPSIDGMHFFDIRDD